MKHIKDTEYNGHELLIYQAGEMFIVDVRSDDFDGDIVYARCGLSSAENAERVGRQFVDSLHQCKCTHQ